MRIFKYVAVLIAFVAVGVGAAFAVGSNDEKAQESATITTQQPGDSFNNDKEWGLYTKENGAAEAVAKLTREAESNPSFGAACHTAAHQIGQVAASLLDLDAALELEPEKCLNGYTHGILQVIAAKPETDFPTLLKACERMHGGKLATECTHGVGHLLALRHPSSLKNALTECVGLKPELIDWCVGGVMMEFGQNYLAKMWPTAYSEIDRTMGPDKPTSINITLSETKSPCTLVKEASDKYQCWSEMGPFIIANSDSLESYPEMAAKCGVVQDTLQWACLYSVFGWLTDNVDENSDDLEVLYKMADNLCRGVDLAYQEGCMNGVFYRIGLPRDLDEISILCDRWTGSLASGCNKGVETARKSHVNAGVE
jgi:hypothetical protein